MWKCGGASVIGSSHRDRSTPCQDFHSWATSGTNNDVIIACCSDGAGSSTYSQESSEYVCRTFIDELCTAFSQTTLDATSIESTIHHIISAIRDGLQTFAFERAIDVREFACTFLGVILTTNYGVFIQIGDGAIVYDDGDTFEPAFWPMHGEHINETRFLTDTDAMELLQYRHLERSLSKVAIMTDGIERLALDFEKRMAHQRFFQALYSNLERFDDMQQFEQALTQWLSSELVTDRTDDDKTLVLIQKHCRGTSDDFHD